MTRRTLVFVLFPWWCHESSHVAAGGTKICLLQIIWETPKEEFGPESRIEGPHAWLQVVWRCAVQASRSLPVRGHCVNCEAQIHTRVSSCREVMRGWFHLCAPDCAINKRCPCHEERHTKPETHRTAGTRSSNSDWRARTTRDHRSTSPRRHTPVIVLTA